jgi:hypothetical protein
MRFLTPIRITDGTQADGRLLTSDANGQAVWKPLVWAMSSSLRYKSEVVDYQPGIVDLLKLRPVQYRSNLDGLVHAGLIAEEVHASGLTEFVAYNDAGQPDALRYPQMVALLINAVRDQQVMINNLMARLDAT